jgi:hypothetical protein
MEMKYGRPYVLKLMDRAEEDCEITVEWELETAAYYLDEIQEMRYGSKRPTGQT